MPLFISKDCHYSIFSPGTHLSLSGGNVEHRTWCPRGAGTDDGWNRHWWTPHKSLHTLPHSQFRKPPPHFSETQDLSFVFRAHKVFSYYFACSAYLDWVTEVLFRSGRSLKRARDWSCPGAAVQVTLEQPSSSPWAAAAEPTVCLMHAFILHVISLWEYWQEYIFIHYNTYVPLWWWKCHHSGITQLTSSFSKFWLKCALGRSRSSQNTASLWHC